MSDLHVHQEDQPYLFTETKEVLFDRLAGEILEEAGKLVIAGDFIDFTGMQRPANGHADFFDELFDGTDRKHPAIVAALRPTDRLSQLAGVAERFPTLFRRLGELARAGLLELIPGNHDCCFRDLAVQAAIESAIGADSGRVRWSETSRVGDVVFAKHGNEFDPSNRTDAQCHNRGVAITSALYQALMPALEVMGVPPGAVYAIPAVRPEELVLRGIEQYVGEARARRLVAAFVRLVARNGYFPAWQKALLFPVIHPVPVLSGYVRNYLTPERLIAAMPEESYMKVHVRNEAERLQATLVPAARIVVLGHTHELDRTPRYINLGTWIDHLTGISLAHLENADTTLPVLRIADDGTCEVHDARDLAQAESIRDCRKVY